MAELTPLPIGERDKRAPVRVGALAERQWGVAGVAQLALCGVDSDRIARWIRDCRLFRLFPGVYAVGRRSLPVEGRLTAALMYAGASSTLSHTTAGWWWGLLPAEPRRIHVSTLGRRRAAPSIALHHPRSLPRTSHRGLPVTTVPRTLLDLAAVLSVSSLRRALAEAEYRRILNPRAVERELGRGKAGSAALRRALEIHLPSLARTRSVLEERFLALCEASAIELPEVNVSVRGLLVDALWRSRRLVVELDGQAAHGTCAAVERDRAREITLRTAGFRVIRYSWGQVTEQPEMVVTDLKRALAGQNWSLPPAPRATQGIQFGRGPAKDRPPETRSAER